jgi:uncharacterized membrane protein YgcG
MDQNARNELDAIKRELWSIIKELEDISTGVRKDFAGIGNDKCADAINIVVNQYYTVYKKLNNIDTKTVTAAFAQSHGGGGGSSSGGGSTRSW